MNAIYNVLSVRRTLSDKLETWDRLRLSPGWLRDRFIGLNHFSDPLNSWEIVEAVVAESVNDSRRDDEYILSLLLNGGDASPTEMNFVDKRFHRPNQPGAIVFLDNSYPISIQGKGPFHAIAIYINKPNLLQRVERLLGHTRFSLEPLMTHCLHDAPLEHMIKELLQAFQQKESFLEREQLMDAITLRLLSLSGNKHCISKANPDSQMMDRVIDYMQSHLSEDLSLETLAEIAGLSRSYFAGAFRHALGVPPSKYLKSLRISKAKELVRSLPVTTTTEHIAFAVGFADHTYLSREFKKATGKSIEAFRRS